MTKDSDRIETAIAPGSMPSAGGTIVHNPETCMGMLRPIRDALDVLSGKWKIPIIVSLTFGPKRFRQMAGDIPGITDKMLSKELKELELNRLVKRTVLETFPPRVEYTLTEHGQTLGKVIGELREWGVLHRNMILGKNS